MISVTGFSIDFQRIIFSCLYFLNRISLSEPKQRREDLGLFVDKVDQL